MLTTLWLTGMIRRRTGRLFGTAVGVALTVAMLVALGVFTAASAATLTRRATADVTVDWQVVLAPGADVRAVTDAVRAAASVTALAPVGYADVAGLSATTAGTTQTTGAGKVLGFPMTYRHTFTSQLRPLIGALDGVLLAQQTAANLHATVGDAIMIQRVGLPPVTVTVAGIVDLPQVDSLFQAIGVPPGSAPQAPPDNIVVLSADQWHTFFDPQAVVRPDSVRTQLHVLLSHEVPFDPTNALILVQQQARNVEARIAGSGMIGNNLAARLDHARQDALYARVLVLFLGLPGVILAGVLTFAVAASGAGRRRQEQALLRVRGGSTTMILWLAGSEALVTGTLGSALGLVLASRTMAWIVPNAHLVTATTRGWTIGGTLLGFALAGVAALAPAWQGGRHTTVAAARQALGRGRVPLWQRWYLDVLLLGGAAAMFARTASTGYQIVLAPEGVPQTSVAYEAFLAPLGAWIGGALLLMRLWYIGLARHSGLLAWVLRPFARGLAPLVAAALGRQRALHTRSVVFVALACAFATSTAAFNTTYTAQSRVDAELTNGADVLVQGTTTAPPSGVLAQLAAVPGVAVAEPIQHRFAYVGTDLQDLFGIRPVQIGTATHLSNAYFANGNAHATLAALAAHADGVLVSEETMQDFQLTPGDTLNLRLQRSTDHQYHIVPFHVVGVVREFPTAPKDSFLVANADYIAVQTGSAAAESVVLRTNGDLPTVADHARAVVHTLPGVHITTIDETQRTVSSSLTAVDLRGLTGLELIFAVLLVLGATGLVLALSLRERQRTFTILVALGARETQLGAWVWSEGGLLGCGALLGGLGGLALAKMLVTLLANVFDPPPETLALPWSYMALVASAALIAGCAALVGGQRAARHGVVERLREL